MYFLNLFVLLSQKLSSASSSYMAFPFPPLNPVYHPYPRYSSFVAPNLWTAKLPPHTLAQGSLKAKSRRRVSSTHFSYSGSACIALNPSSEICTHTERMTWDGCMGIMDIFWKIYCLYSSSVIPLTDKALTPLLSSAAWT